MVAVVQLVERQFVDLVVAGSNPVGHPNNLYLSFAGVAQLVERQPSKLNVASSTLVSRSNKDASLAQMVEHTTFNRVVTGSSPV